MSKLAARLRCAIDLHEAGVQIMQLQLGRRYPNDSEAEIAARLRDWLRGPPPKIPDHREVPWPRS